MVIRAWVRAASRAAKAAGKPLSTVLDEINDGILASGPQSGGIVISSSEAGGSVTFALPPGHTPLELAALNEESIAWCNQWPDPENPPMVCRRIKRMRASFAKARP